MGICVHRKRNYGTGRLWLFTILFASIWAYQASLVAGIGSTVLFTAVAAHAVRKAWKEL
jgi:hypothetical protein